MTRLIAWMFVAGALLGCAAPGNGDLAPLVVFDRSSAARTDTMTIYPDGQTEMNHGGHIERLTLTPAIMDELRVALTGPIIEADATGEPRYVLTLGRAAPLEIAVDEGSLGALLLRLIETHDTH